MSIITKVLNQPELLAHPPVLIDIGASGAIHPYWKAIARYAICIAFDGDERDFTQQEKSQKDYKKLFIFNRLLSVNCEEKDFYLTKAPHCSSLLKPDTKSLAKWAYSNKFEVEKTVKLKSIDLVTVLNDLNIKQIDWYKSDSQGIDLKLFKSLPDNIRDSILIAEFEPGILDAYEGEDKMHHILSYMDDHNNFWLSRLTLKGTQRIEYGNLKSIFKNDFLSKVSPHINKSAPGWGEMVFINSFEHFHASKRDMLLGWVLATIQHEHGFAYQLAKTGLTKFEDKIFEELKGHSAMKVRLGMISLKYIPLLFRKSNELFN